MTYLVNRLDKIGGRYRELSGKPFEKISEQRLTITDTIKELKESITELDKNRNKNRLQIQKLQRVMILQQRNLSDLAKKARLAS